LFHGYNFKLEDNGTYPPLIIFYQRAVLPSLFRHQRTLLAAGWLRRFLQAGQQLNAKTVTALKPFKQGNIIYIQTNRSLHGQHQQNNRFNPHWTNHYLMPQSITG
jgi:hypothetical protein